MVHFDNEISEHVLKRLINESVIWLTTVSSDGTPQPNPVWFYWDGETCLIYSQPGSARLRNIARNPKVALHFEGATIDGGDVVVLKGEASMDRNTPGPPTDYRAKYATFVDASGITWEQLHSEYNVEIRIRLSGYRVR